MHPGKLGRVLMECFNAQGDVVVGWTLRAAAAAIALALQGCASIVGGSMQPISLQSTYNGESVSGASCSLTNDKGTWFVSTPGSATVQRSIEDMLLKCTKAQLPAGEVSAKSLVRPLAFGNILFGGIIGGGVDHVTGAAYYYPELVTVEMGRSIRVTATPVVGSTPAPTEIERPPMKIAAPEPAPASTPAAPSTPAPTAVVPAATPAQPAAPPSQRPAGAQRPIGQESYQVARMPEVKACNANPEPVLIAKTGSSLETYAVACTAGSGIVVNCEWGSCRVAK